MDYGLRKEILHLDIKNKDEFLENLLRIFIYKK